MKSLPFILLIMLILFTLDLLASQIRPKPPKGPPTSRYHDASLDTETQPAKRFNP